MQKQLLSQKIITFNKNLNYKGSLPSQIQIMNPFRENPYALKVSSVFYKKYYDDDNHRKLILGINPGRFGAGVTGIPFTDTKRLVEKCGIPWEGDPTHETSSVFVYEVIDAYGGVEKFYNEFFIQSVSPLGFVKKDDNGKEKNFNYYDSKELLNASEPFILDSLKKILRLGVRKDICFCLGNGKNFKYLHALNEKMNFFEKIIPLEHPRFVMQYRSKHKNEYVKKYLAELKK